MRRFQRTTLITVGCVSVLAGLGMAKKFSLEIQTAWLLLAPFMLMFRRKNLSSLLVIVVCGLLLGLWRGNVYAKKLDLLSNLQSQMVVVEGTAASDSIYSYGSQLETVIKDIKLVNFDSQPLAGKFRVSGYGLPMIYRGDRIKVSGKLYMTRGSNQARISYAQLTLVGKTDNPIYSFARKFSAGMQSALPEPAASFGLGILIGQRNSLPQEITDQLVMVGLVHIVAVSGYNLTILVRLVGRLKLASKYQRLIASLSLISVFVLITGFSPSIVRAAAVSTLSLWAWYYGRKFKPIVLLAIVAAATGLANPFYIWGDIGWYLSFLAFFGVLVIAPAIAGRFKRRPKLLLQVILETLCAEIMALPLIMMIFGQLSLVGLLANVLVVPLIPLAMLLSAVAAFAGMLTPALAGWLAWPADILLTYILDIAALLAGIPSIFMHWTISLRQMLFIYSAVCLVLLIQFRKLASKKPLVEWL